METTRDLGQVEPWLESLERSRARRAEAARPASRSARRAARRSAKRASKPSPGESPTRPARRASEPSASESATRPAVTPPEATPPAVAHPEPTPPAVAPRESARAALTHPEATRPSVVLLRPTPPAVAHSEPARPAARRPPVTRPAARRPAVTRPVARRPPVTRPARRSLVTRPAGGRTAVIRPAPGRPATRTPGHSARRWLLAVSAVAVAAIAAVAVSSTNAFDTGGAQASTAGLHGAAVLTPRPTRLDSARELQGVAVSAPTRLPACRPVVTAAGYMNPLARARVTPERIDQGVDYAGSGTLVAIGSGQVTHIGIVGTGWPGAFIEYRLTAGADDGCYVYYAEGVTPARGLHVGETVAADQPIASLIRDWGTGIEIGWGAGKSTKTYADLSGNWSVWKDADNIPSLAGKNFSALIRALGGPPGKVEG